MTEQDLRNLVGRIEGRLDEIKDAVDSQARESSKSRAALYERVNLIATKLESEIMQLRSEMHAMNERVTRIEPIAATVTDWKAQRNLLLKLGAGGVTVISLGVAIGMLLVNLLKNGS